jgi:hypothetical protein
MEPGRETEMNAFAESAWARDGVEQSCERGAVAEMALGLTEEEAMMLLTLCAGSSADGGTTEQRLFAKIGAVLRGFRYDEGGEESVTENRRRDYFEAIAA